MTILNGAVALLLASIAFTATASALPITFTDGPDTLVVTAENQQAVASLGDIHAGGGDDVINLSLYPDAELNFPGRVFLGEGNDTR